MLIEQFQERDLVDIKLPDKLSHKGENGRVLVIGGSSLFHSSSLWAAEMLAHFVDMVFYHSPFVPNQDLLRIKQYFRNGIIVGEAELWSYAQEADVILIGPGMKRQGDNNDPEGLLTHQLTNELLRRLPNKRTVVDAGALQELEITNLHLHCLLTPQEREFNNLFPAYQEDYAGLIRDYPATYLLKKSGTDYCFSSSNQQQLIKIQAGNEGLTKGGTGDLLAGLVAALYVKNPPLLAAAAGSYILNKTADQLYQQLGPFYTTTHLLDTVPAVFWQILKRVKNLKLD